MTLVINLSDWRIKLLTKCFLAFLKRKNSMVFHVRKQKYVSVLVCVCECVCEYNENGLCYKIEAVKRGASDRLKGMFYE